jgi:hypothetical protein
MSDQAPKTADVEEILSLLNASTQEVSEYLGRAVERLPKVVELLRDGDAGNGMAEVASLMQALSGLMEYAQAIAGLPDGITSIDANEGKRLAEAIGELLPMLMPALEGRDPVLLADVLEYEMLPMLSGWHPVVQGWERELGL